MKLVPIEITVLAIATARDCARSYRDGDAPKGFERSQSFNSDSKVVDTEAYIDKDFEVGVFMYNVMLTKNEYGGVCINVGFYDNNDAIDTIASYNEYLAKGA